MIALLCLICCFRSTEWSVNLTTLEPRCEKNGFGVFDLDPHKPGQGSSLRAIWAKHPFIGLRKKWESPKEKIYIFFILVFFSFHHVSTP